MQLTAYLIDATHPLEREKALERVRCSGQRGLLLNTCQRLEFYTLDPVLSDGIGVSQKWHDALAFERLARIAAGLESRILGELEILGQVRTAYKFFHEAAGMDNTKLDRLFQDALSLARRARRESGIDRNLTSLSAISARMLIENVTPGDPVAVIGTGSMASSVARYLGKRGRSPLRISSRCPDRAMSLALEVGGFGTGMDQLAHQFKDVAGIICATAAPHPVVYTHHIQEAKRPLFIVDLGVPADCDKDVIHMPDVQYMGLEEIEAKAQINTGERHARAEVAARIIRDGALAWSKSR